MTQYYFVGCTYRQGYIACTLKRLRFVFKPHQRGLANQDIQEMIQVKAYETSILSHHPQIRLEIHLYQRRYRVSEAVCR